MPVRVKVNGIFPDETNPRKADNPRMHLLKLSLQKLGFVQPIYVNKKGMILSGHQRQRAASEMGLETIPVAYVDLSAKQEKGINILFNRATNDFTAFDTGKSASQRLDLSQIMALAEELPDWEGEDFWAYDVKEESIVGLGSQVKDEYNRKALLVTSTLRRYGIRIPIVLTESGAIVNGIHRLFEARHEGIDTWPVVRIPDEYGELARNLLNYLSMDYAVDSEFSTMLRYSAYRRPQNHRGTLPKGMRFWAAGERTIPDAEAYSQDFWRNFRALHGNTILDFGSGLGNATRALLDKGFDCVEFEPYRIRTKYRSRRRRSGGGGGSDSGNGSTLGPGNGRPDSEYSREGAREFLRRVEDGTVFESIFLASVLNSIPFPRDRQCVLAIVHSLCSFETITYGTCRDFSDFLYEYSGIRNATYFVFDSEPGVRLGDALSNPKIQKFFTQEEFRQIASPFWKTVETWAGGNIFYWRCSAPKRVNPKALAAALEFEFDLPYADGSTMNLVREAKAAFGKRLGIELR